MNSTLQAFKALTEPTFEQIEHGLTDPDPDVQAAWQVRTADR